MFTSDEEDEKSREKELKQKANTPPRKRKVLKVGGLWIDPQSFPSFDDEKDADPTPHT